MAMYRYLTVRVGSQQAWPNIGMPVTRNSTCSAAKTPVVHSSELSKRHETVRSNHTALVADTVKTAETLAWSGHNNCDVHAGSAELDC